MGPPTTFFLSVFVLDTVWCQYSLVERGQKYSEDESRPYRIYFESPAGDLVSSWHDIPLYSSLDNTNNTYNMIIEIPRYLPNVFPWHGSLCNYGAFPQTWENPFHEDPWTGLRGDRDPLDVCELGTDPLPTGSVVPVKVIGILGLLDKSETDWKVVVINAKEADEKHIESMEDLEASFPNMLDTVRDFFRIYKVPAGKPENKFAFDGQFREPDFAKEVIRTTHSLWQEMVSNCSISGLKEGNFSTTNTQLDTDCTISQEEAQKEVLDQADHSPDPAARPEDVDSWSFVTTSSSMETVRPAMWLVVGLVIKTCLTYLSDND